METSKFTRIAQTSFEPLEPRLLLSTTFQDSTASFGLPTTLPSQYLHASAVADVNGDGYLDVFYGSWSGEGPNKLYLTNGSPALTESVQNAINKVWISGNLVAENGRTSGAAFADLDNDGDQDLVISQNNKSATNAVPNQLLRNDGNGIFTDVTAGSNIDGRVSGRNVFIIDYNGDGWLDVLMQDDIWGNTDHSRLLRNNGNMTFTEVTSAAGLPSSLTGIGGAVGDFNGDGWQDFVNVGLLSTYRANIEMFINNQNGTFTKSTTFDFSATFPWYGNTEDWVCGAAVGDLDGDGDMDLVIGQHYGSAHYGNQRVTFRVYRNNGNSGVFPTWTDVTTASGVQLLYSKMAHIDIQDFDNDGRMDIWNAVTMELKDSETLTPYVQFNNGNVGGVPTFVPPPNIDPPTTDEGYHPTTRDKYNPRYSPGSPTGDFDRDGLMDIFWEEAFHDNHYSTIWENTGTAGNWLDVQVRLTSGNNRQGVGSKVEIYQAGHLGEPAYRLGTYWMEIANGYTVSRPAIAHFGLGSYSGNVDVRVTMPSGGSVYTATNVTKNQLVTVPYVGDTTPPTVTSAVINRGAAQRSQIKTLDFTFSENVVVAKEDLTLYDYSTSSLVNLAAATFSYDAGTYTAKWDLTAVDLNNSYHTATLLAANITDLASNHLDGDGNGTGGDNYTYLLFRLAGDANGDGSTDVGDLGILGANYNDTGNWWELPGDMNADGSVDVGDLGILGANYNTSVTPPPGGGETGGGLAGPSEQVEQSASVQSLAQADEPASQATGVSTLSSRSSGRRAAPRLVTFITERPERAPAAREPGLVDLLAGA